MRKSPVTTRLAAISLAAIAGLTACGTSHRAPIHPASTGPAITDPMTLVADMGGTATYPEQTLPSGDK